jgi:hypothetical protein
MRSIVDPLCDELRLEGDKRSPFQRAHGRVVEGLLQLRPDERVYGLRATLDTLRDLLGPRDFDRYLAQVKPARAPSAHAGLRRVAVGIVTMFVAYAALRPAYQALRSLHGVATTAVVSGVGALLFAVLRFFAEYAAHAGLADIQIGLMRQLRLSTRWPAVRSDSPT